MSEPKLEEVKNLVAQVKQAPALEAVKLAREISKAVEQSNVLDQSRASNRLAEEMTRQSINEFKEAVLRSEQERSRHFDDALRQQQEMMQKMLEVVKREPARAEITEKDFAKTKEK